MTVTGCLRYCFLLVYFIFQITIGFSCAYVDKIGTEAFLLYIKSGYFTIHFNYISELTQPSGLK